MKKGFTIVELAIVLVVIGIILAMAVKGKTLVDAARVKSDLAKYTKLQAAVATYYARTENFPPLKSDSFADVDMDYLVNRGYITYADLKMTALKTDLYHTAGQKSEFLALEYCVLRASNKYPGEYQFYRVTFRNQPYNKVCIYTTTAPFDGHTNILTSKFIVCNLEMHLDDENELRGQGRTSIDFTTMLKPEDYRDCDRFRRAKAESVYYFQAL